MESLGRGFVLEVAKGSCTANSRGLTWPICSDWFHLIFEAASLLTAVADTIPRAGMSTPSMALVETVEGLLCIKGHSHRRIW